MKVKKINKYLDHVRDLWLMLGLSCILFLGLEIIARGYYLFRYEILAPNSSIQKEYQIDERENSESYKFSPWVIDYFRELQESGKSDWYSYVYWRRKAYSGNYINIDSSGTRKTYNTIPLSKASKKIFMFGGSTIWGTGARDEYTIPSFVSKMLDERSHDEFYIVNFGESGYVSTQELIQLILELKKGNIPNIVIFYDGVNDVFSAFQNKIVGIPQNEYNRRKEFGLHANIKKAVNEVGPFDLFRRYSAFARLVLNRKDKIIAKYKNIAAEEQENKIMQEQPNLRSSLDSLAEKTVYDYFANIRIIGALSREYQFEAFFFWQPTIYSKGMLSSEEERTRKIHQDGRESFFNLAYSKISSVGNKPMNFYDIQKVFTERKETVFIDFCHLGEQGNQIVANIITRTLMENSKTSVSD